jgi:peptidoglycan/LPS O-acetylase OafA/YrhL
MTTFKSEWLQIWQALARNARRRLSLGSLKSALDVSPEREAVSPTAWLNGMRGLAALFVFFYHFGYAYFPWLPLGFASGDGNYHIIQLPFLRLLICGPSMVAIFFLVSGYSLSIGPLKELQNGSSGKCLDRTASAIFRRPVRLFLPSIASTFIVMICVSLGLYTRGDKMRNEENQPGWREDNPWIYANLWEQFWDWAGQTAQWLMIWRFDHGNHSYDCHLWTLPVEFRCSIILFTTIVAVANSRVRARLLILLCMVVYCHFSNFWEGWLFFAGALLAQIKLSQGPPPQLPSVPRKWYQGWKNRGTVLLFLLGLYLLSAPDYNGESSA